jgi:hypothetical protein
MRFRISPCPGNLNAVRTMAELVLQAAGSLARGGTI